MKKLAPERNTVARNKLNNLQHQSLNLLSDVATHTTDFNEIVADLAFIEDAENIPPPISAILPACSLSPEYVVRSPTPPLCYPSPITTTTIQPPPTIAETYLVNYSLFPHLFAEPPCTQVVDTHPHLYTVVYEAGKKIWCPQDEYIHRNPLGIIPRVQDLDNLSPFFVTPFQALTHHEVRIPSPVLPAITICAKVGRHPSSLHFPFSYLESSFVDSLKFIFGQFPPDWLTYFEGALIPVIMYDFLDGCLATLIGRLHFTDEGLFIIERQVRTEDLLRTNPSLFAFVPTPHILAKPLSHVTPPDDDLPL